ncbi:MAG TPA: hypothetical protein VG095_04550 [Chthoniobacterales bacterium]|nr:hypothetical protein [Chthoniobacterales bacterium]
MRNIKLTGREGSVVRVIGFAEGLLGSEIQEQTHMDPEDLTDTLNSLLSAGFAESIPYRDVVSLGDMPTTAFELNPAYAHQLRAALQRR